MDTNELLSIEDAARLLGRTERMIRYAVARGTLPHVEMYGKRLVTRAALEKYRGVKAGRPRKQASEVVEKS